MIPLDLHSRRRAEPEDIHFDVKHLEPNSELIEQHFDFDEPQEPWLNFLNQFIDFRIVRSNGAFLGVNYNGSLEGSPTPLVWQSLKKGNGNTR
jgi:hypothetical protein